jgi:multicomponent Na+:H+ antiporter subunit E
VSTGSTPSRVRHQLPLLAWLVLVWILLWGTLSWANVVSGVVVALLLMLLLPLPPVAGGARVRPLSSMRTPGGCRGSAGSRPRTLPR